MTFILKDNRVLVMMNSICLGYIEEHRFYNAEFSALTCDQLRAIADKCEELNNA